MRGLSRLGAVGCAVLVVSSCSTQQHRAATPSPSPARSARSAVQTSAAPVCHGAVVALDPGHNPVRIDAFDPKTGAAQIDYPNGAEDRDVFDVARQVAATLRGRGYRVVFLKRTVDENVTYRQRVDRAEQAHAAIGISIHTSPGAHEVFAQRVGLYREGQGADGATLRVRFTDAATASSSERYAAAVAAARSRSEGHPVSVTDNDFGGRAPLWSGNIPIIELLAERTPWVYNEFGTATTGGSIAVPAAALRTYAQGIADGVETALPSGC